MVSKILSTLIFDDIYDFYPINVSMWVERKKCLVITSILKQC